MLLAISGKLDPTMYGPSVPVYLSPFMEGRGRPRDSGPLDGANRRSIYLEVRRNFLSPMMTAFDTPTPFSSMGRRNSSNVPAQALIMMNDPLIVQLAGGWSKRAIEKVSSSEEDWMTKRIGWMYLTAYARTPSENENALAKKFLLAHAADNQIAVTDDLLWADFAHVLINKKEFIFQR